MTLLPMDCALLRRLVEFGGRVPTISVPAKLFAGEIPSDAPNLVELGLIKHIGGDVAITPAGRAAIDQVDRWLKLKEAMS